MVEAVTPKRVDASGISVRRLHRLRPSRAVLRMSFELAAPVHAGVAVFAAVVIKTAIPGVTATSPPGAASYSAGN
jgi:hypothetical protein